MNDIRKRLLAALILIGFLAACAPAAPTSAPPAYWPTYGWLNATPEEQGMDSQKLAQMVGHIQGENLNLHSLLIVRNGYLVTALYPYPYSADQAHAVFSVTKSVIGALIGIAIQKGYIKNVHESLSSFLPNPGAARVDPEKQAVTLENLLTQTSGLECHENPAPGEAYMQASPDWVQFMLNQPMASQPGTKFNYCTSALELLSAVLQKATGESAREFANQNLFAPLGIGPIPESRWPSDPQGVTIGGYGLALTPNEMAKLGYLFLQQGQWAGKTIVPAEWVATSTAIHSDQGDTKEYGYLWWVDPEGKWYAALGRSGQHIFVYPAENLVIVFTAALPFTHNADLAPLQELTDQYILPAIQAGGPLPPNPAGAARLEAALQALGQPPRTTPSPLPGIAAAINGKTYTLEENSLGWHTVTFTFPEGAEQAMVTVDGQPRAIGLANLYCPVAGGDTPFPEGLRGRWESPDTFVVDDVVIGQTVQFTYRVQFSGDAIHIIRQEELSGSPMELNGTQETATQ